MWIRHTAGEFLLCVGQSAKRSGLLPHSVSAGGFGPHLCSGAKTAKNQVRITRIRLTLLVEAPG